LKGKKDIKIGDLVKKVVDPGSGKLAMVIAKGADQNQTTLANWIRVQYIDGTGYEWIQKRGIELITKD
jgi:hypothetical protein|tara:strand:+ start:1585 stop:1788 length:204 start_codon:yes stop_codon:yes gene_type:complete